MTLKEKIESLIAVSNIMSLEDSDELEIVISRAIAENPWFTREGISHCFDAISSQFLDREVLENWTDNYDIKNVGGKRVGLVLAGNIPMVGFHDILSVFLSGHQARIKYSHKDKQLLSWFIDKLNEIDPRTKDYFSPVERLKDIDAVIATGGPTAATHFNYYFSKYPHIIRKNRSSAAILTEEDTEGDLKGLGSDIFTYFGLGCRNISKIYIPIGFSTDRIFESIIDYAHVLDHNKYKNNFDYSYAIYLLGKDPFLTNNFLILREDEALSSRIACLHYEEYEDIDQVVQSLMAREEEIQCVTSTHPISSIPHTPIGRCQQPAIDDYADRVDTMTFLTSLYD